jgi:hypothetical protein
MISISKKLISLHSRATEKGQWPLACAISVALRDESGLDNQINVIGAMQEAGCLRNSLQPFWDAWRSDTAVRAWASRCIERLRSMDTDYWALAGLLGLPLSAIRASLTEASYRLLSIRFAQSFKENERHIAVFCLSQFDAVISPVLEIGWDSVTGEVVDAARWRAVLLERQTILNGNLVGCGDGSYFMRAGLPYGIWRIHETVFELSADHLVERSRTLLADYH